MGLFGRFARAGDSDPCCLCSEVVDIERVVIRFTVWTWLAGSLILGVSVALLELLFGACAATWLGFMAKAAAAALEPCSCRSRSISVV